MSGPSRVATTGIEQGTTFYSGISSGLQLQIQLNATQVPQEGALKAQVLLFNTLPESTLFHPNFTANPRVPAWDRYDSLCGLSPVDHIFGFALFEGHYTAANISAALSGTPVLLTPPVASSCPNPFYDQAYIQNIEFAPKSDAATLSANSSFSDVFGPQTLRMEENASTGGCSITSYTELSRTDVVDGKTTTYGPTGYLTYGCGLGSALDGYWTKPSNGSYVEISMQTNKTVTSGIHELYADNFHPLLSTEYTLVAEDIWNQTAFAYFSVGGISLQDFSLCSSNCTYPSPYLSGFIYFSGPAPLKSLQLIVNGTDQGVQPEKGLTPATFVEWYKGGFQNPPVVKGDTYVLRFVATYEDNSTATASTVVVAS